MKFFYSTLSSIITLFLYLIVGLISIHYISYYTPEEFIFNVQNYDIIKKIEMIDIFETILSLFLIVILYFLSFKVHKIKKYRPQLLILSNIILLIVLIVYYIYWNTSFFYEWLENSDSFYYGLSSESYGYLKIFTFLSILSSIILNLHFLSSLISNRKKFKFIIFVFIPIISLIFLKYHSFFKSKVLIWVKLQNEENKYSKTEFLNLSINENALIWHKGFEKWVTYEEFKKNTHLEFIK